MIERILQEAFIIGFLAAAVRMATPILLTAVGEIFAERSGILNIGVEGIMLVGALSAFLSAYFSGNLWLGLTVAMVAGATMGLLMAYLSVTLRANQVVAGIAINIFAFGATTFVYRIFFGTGFIPPMTERFPTIPIPLLSRIPYLGPSVFSQIAPVYIALGLVPLAWLVLFWTQPGVSIRAVGEVPKAADTVGINVFRVRYACVIVGGVLAGLGGATLSLGHMSLFTENMTAGRGFIALAIVIFSKWDPLRALWASLLFGAADGLQLRLQALGVAVPFQFLLMLPYLLTVAVLVGVVSKAEAPASLVVPYTKEEA